MGKQMAISVFVIARGLLADRPIMGDMPDLPDRRSFGTFSVNSRRGMPDEQAYWQHGGGAWSRELNRRRHATYGDWAISRRHIRNCHAQTIYNSSSPDFARHFVR
jgi:hypothetical protein